MKPAHFLDYRAVGIAGLLRSERLAVPPYQRSYSWRTREDLRLASVSSQVQVVDFWTDLRTSYSNKSAYFLGTVVLAPDPDGSGRKLVIDGQQRLATASLLLSAVRDHLRQGGEDASANSVQHEYLAQFDRQAKAERPKLVLNTDDRDYYTRTIIQSERGVVPKNASQQLIEEAYAYLAGQVGEFSHQFGSAWDSKLNDFIDWMDNQVQVISISVSDEGDAYTIFETLNDRGADLTIADLLKNYLFKHGGNRIDEVRDNWTVTLSNLTSTASSGNIAFGTFARHLLSSREGLVRQRDVYGRMKRSVTNVEQAVAFSLDLRDSSEVYRSLMDADSDYWTRFPDTQRVTAAVSVLADLKIERYRPMVLAALDTFATTEASIFLLSLLNWSIRMLCVGRLGGGVSEAAFCDAAKEIRDGSVKSSAELLRLTRLETLIPTDTVFRAAFREWSPPTQISRYLLRALELEARGEEEPELIVNTNVDQVNLEHILPKNSTRTDWPQYTRDEARLFVGRLGNHCLLQKGPNGRLGNKPWSTKKPVFANSSLLLTRELCDQEDWTKEAIVARQEKLADMAIKVWPR